MMMVMISGSDTVIKTLTEIHGCINLILLVSLLAILSVSYSLLVCHISCIWRKMMKISDYILLGTAFVLGCGLTYLLNT